MPHKNKVRGNGFEREIVAAAQARGLASKRAWGSDGRSMGMDAEVDCLVEDYRVQAKRRKKLADYLQIPEHCDAVAFRQDRGKTLVLVDMDLFLKLVKNECALRAMGADVVLDGSP